MRLLFLNSYRNIGKSNEILLINKIEYEYFLKRLG